MIPKFSLLGFLSRVILFVGTALVLILIIRGLSGNPTSADLLTSHWSHGGPLELSPERGRFALLYSVIENHSLIFDVSVARLAVPDLAINSSGQYVSLFAPAVSLMAAPGYLLGKFFGIAQVGSYSIIALFAFFNVLLIQSIASRLGAGRVSSVLGALAFLFATPALPYATTLYQHHISVFLLLFSLWVLLAMRNIWSLTLVWFACALSVVVDNPNLFFMFPVGLFSLMRLFSLVQTEKGFQAKKVVVALLTVLGFVPPLVLFGWYNQSAYGNPFQLAGTLQGVSEIGSDGRPAIENSYEKQVLSPEERAERELAQDEEKTAVGFFKTRNLYNGFYIHFLSPDRGVIYFSPVILLGIVGLALLYRRNAQIAALLIASIGANILLYSMWGDPWGGWAFGSRYLIPTYALLAIGMAFGFSQWRFRTLFLAVFIPLFAYSAWVNTLAAVTTNANPPEVQVLSLEKQSGHEEKYTFLRNWEYLNGRYQPANAKSFMYQIWANRYLSPKGYFCVVYGAVLLVAALGMGGLLTEIYRKGKRN